MTTQTISTTTTAQTQTALHLSETHTMQKLNEKLTHNEFTAELVEDRHGKAIMLTQADGDCDGPCSVLIHPWQLRAVCENFGLLTADPQAEKTIAMLTRRLQLLNSRIQHLNNWLRTLSDSDHADLTYEIGFSGGTSDMAAEFCAELMDTNTPEATPAPASKASAKATPPQASLI